MLSLQEEGLVVRTVVVFSITATKSAGNAVFALQSLKCLNASGVMMWVWTGKQHKQVKWRVYCVLMCLCPELLVSLLYVAFMQAFQWCNGSVGSVTVQHLKPWPLIFCQAQNGFCPDWNVPTTIRWTFIKLCMNIHIHGTQGMNPDDFSDPLTSSLAPTGDWFWRTFWVKCFCTHRMDCHVPVRINWKNFGPLIHQVASSSGQSYIRTLLMTKYTKLPFPSGRLISMLTC